MPRINQTRLLLLLIFFSCKILGQAPRLPGYIVKAYGAANGLPASEILSLYQDSKDFIWIGTKDGVARFDGKSFRIYDTVKTKRIGAVYQVQEDDQGQLWLATESGLYSWKNEIFIEQVIEQAASFLPFYAVDFTNSSEVWIGSLKGLLLLKKSGDVFKAEKLTGWNTVSMGPVLHISHSSTAMAFSTDLHVYLYKEQRLQKIPNPLKAKDLVHGVHITSQGRVYFINLLGGLHYWEGGYTIPPEKNTEFYFNMVNHKGKLYAYNTSSVEEINPVSGERHTVFFHSPLNIRTPTRLMLDRENNFWLGSNEGLFQVKKNLFSNISQQLPFSDEIYSMLRRRNGTLLFGSNRGTVFEWKDSLKYFMNHLQVVPLAEIFAMYEDEKDGIWFATGYQGLALLRNGKLQRFDKKNGLADNSHYAFLRSGKGELWTAGDNGITRINFDSTKDNFRFKYFEYPVDVTYHKLFGMSRSPAGRIWAGGQLGLFYLDQDSLRPYQLPQLKERLVITSMKQSNDGKVWITTRGSGILVCSFDSRENMHLEKQFLDQDGLSGNTYLSLCFDTDQNLWAGSYNSVTAIQQSGAQPYRIINFDAEDGFINKNFQSLSMNYDGELVWACTSSGAVSFHPGKLLKHIRHASLRITAVEFPGSAEDPLSFKNEKGNFLFPWDHNTVSIRFAALYFSNPGAVRYFYRLLPSDTSWTDAGKEGVIHFRQLKTGNYELQLRATLGGNDTTNMVTMHFEIVPPWWQRWWFIAGLILLSALSAYLFIKRKEERFRKAQQDKTAVEKLRSDSYKHQLEIEQVINYFTISLSGLNSVEAVLWDVARNCISRLGFEDCVIYLLDPEKNKLVQKAAWGPKTSDGNEIFNPIEIALGEGIVGNVALTGKAERINDTSKDPRYIIDDDMRFSELTVPIFEEGRVIGVIDSEHHQKNFYSEQHLQILATIASHCGARIGRIKAEAREQSARMEALLNRQKALEASLQSMRLQMNPHFLFNALNSIQQMILAGEEMTATRFLSKFSRLLRLVLTSSDREELPLKEELEILQLYIELESLRFKESFSYQLIVGKEVDVEETCVPSLLFQPFVENAIWHGLMHLDGEKKLFISFEEIIDGVLRCIIEDNGVGRTAAGRNKNGNEMHTGKGIKLGIERLAALNEKFRTDNTIEIIDLFNEKDQPAGTRIEIRLNTGSQL